MSQLPAGPALAQKIYRWVDDNGVVHYTDFIPPEHANRARDILNEDGVRVSSQGAALSAEQIAEQNRLLAEQEAQRKAREEQEARDRILLDTYLSVEDIESRRDRRLELLDSQITITDQYLERLKQRMRALDEEAANYRPSDAAADAEPAPPLEPMPELLTREIAQTRESIESYEEALRDTRNERSQLEMAFAADIERFKELKGID